MRRFVRLFLACVLGLVLAPIMASPPQASAAVDIYITPGKHFVNGREWNTTCEPYSQTMRCRTDIKATKVAYVAGKFVPTTDWVFNNLTYTASARSLWKGNPLGAGGAVGGKASWTAVDGRKWTTECDTATTGRNGCRSYVEARVVEPYLDAKGDRAYRWVTKWIFNNMVRFTAETVVAPTPSPSPTVPVGSIDLNAVVDAALRACIQAEAGIGTSRYLSATTAAGIDFLDCADSGIRTLKGMPALPNLEELYLERNELTTLSGIPALPKLMALFLDGNRVSSLAGMPNFPELLALSMTSNQMTALPAMPALSNLAFLWLDGNEISEVAPLAQRSSLVELYLEGNPVTDLETLQPLFDADCYIDVWPY